MTDNLYRHPEPVPPASQLAILPFLAAVDGYLRESGNVQGLRITVHRTMSREGHRYLQQACAYLRENGGETQGKVGRTFAVDTGIIGPAYDTHQIWRTKHFADVESLRNALHKDKHDPNNATLSWLAVPFLSPKDDIVLILFADCNELNFFADDDRIRRIAAMGQGFCRLFDWLQREPFSNLRNFPLQKGTDVRGVGGVYNVQEAVPSILPPRFESVASFNYEASVA